MPEEQFKYIAVRNWAKFQGRMKNGKTRRPFILVACAMDSDPDFSLLSFFQRQTLELIRRLIGLHGQNVPNDIEYVLRAGCVGRKDRPHVPLAVRTLTARGFLILTNEKDPFSPKFERKEGKEGKEGVLPEAEDPTPQDRQDPESPYLNPEDFDA